MKLPLELLLLSSAALSAPLTPRSASFPQLAGLTHLTKDRSTTDSRFPQKYFHESIHHPHYDGRFAASVLPRIDRLFHMRLLLRSFTMAMQRARVRTWVMHGSLLGWWWNGRVFPWDSDLDFCVDEAGMVELGAWWNMTVHEFSAVELGMDLGLGGHGEGRDDDQVTRIWDSTMRGGGGAGTEDMSAVGETITEPHGLKKDVWNTVLQDGKKYLLEVNPHFVDTTTSDIFNRIDARWIDTSTGLFIDLTTVHPVPSPDAATPAERSQHKIFLAQADGALKKTPSPNNKAKEMYTKDTHLYDTASLFPLRESHFEGTRVFVPYAYEQILIEEYGPRALTETWFNSYRFDQEAKEWLLAPEPDMAKGRGDREGAAGRFRKGGKITEWKPEDDGERSQKDNVGDLLYTPKPGSTDDVHVVPGGAS